MGMILVVMCASPAGTALSYLTATRSTAAHGILHLRRSLLLATRIVETVHVVVAAAMKRQHSHTVCWECEAGALPRTPALQTLPHIPGKNTLSLHTDMLALKGL